MTDETMALRQMLEKGSDATFLDIDMKARAGWRERTPPGFEGEEERPRENQVVIVRHSPEPEPERTIIDADDTT